MTRTGREVAVHYPGLSHPQTSYEKQCAAMRDAQSHSAQRIVDRINVWVRRASHSHVQASVCTSRAQAQQMAQRLVGSCLPKLLGWMSIGNTQ